MNCSDCNELYKERKQTPPCDSCEIGKKFAEEVAILNAEYLSFQEQVEAEAEGETRRQTEEECLAEQFGENF
jgi:hypothetical protein